MADQKSILLFDGVCNLCNGFVKFIIKHDKNNIFKFAALQSDEAKKLLQKFNLPSKDLSTLVLIKNGEYFIKSNAVFEIIKQLGGLWKLLMIFKIFPKQILNFIYDRVANMRYKILGKQESCMVPSKEIIEKFIL